MAIKDPERKKLKKLNRVELLQLLLAQTQKAETLRMDLDKANAALNDRSIQIAEAGDLAHAVLGVNNIMSSAQEAANQYLENIAAMKRDAENYCLQLLSEAKEAARQICEMAMYEQVVTEESPEEILLRLNERIVRLGE